MKFYCGIWKTYTSTLWAKSQKLYMMILEWLYLNKQKEKERKWNEKKWQTNEEKTCREKRFKISFILYANFSTKNVLNIKVILRSKKKRSETFV